MLATLRCHGEHYKRQALLLSPCDMLLTLSYCTKFYKLRGDMTIYAIFYTCLYMRLRCRFTIYAADATLLLCRRHAFFVADTLRERYAMILPLIFQLLYESQATLATLRRYAADDTPILRGER